MRVFVYILVGLLFLGCSTKQLPQNSLYKELSLLDIDTKEAKELAFKADDFSKTLNAKFEVTSPPLFHNFLVNIGLKDKGLCYHFAYAMFENLNKLPHQSYELFIIKANYQEYFEHTAVAVCKPKTTLQECVVLDAWRDSKNLFYAKIKDDKYKWQKR